MRKGGKEETEERGKTVEEREGFLLERPEGGERGKKGKKGRKDCKKRKENRKKGSIQDKFLERGRAGK